MYVRSSSPLIATILPRMPANKLRRLSSCTLALLIAVLLCALPPVSIAQSTSPALPSDVAGTPSSSDDVASAAPGTTEPAAATTSSLPPPSAATTAPKMFPLPGAAAGGEYLPGPEGGYLPGVGGTYLPGPDVASALPVPTPDELPSVASLGFGGHGDECCGGGGYGWFGGPGGFGPGTYGYNGPLYFGAAPPARNVLLPLVVACVSAAIYYL